MSPPIKPVRFTGASTLGDRTAVSAPEGRTRARSLRGSNLSRLAPPRRTHGRRLHLSATRAPPRSSPAVHVSSGAWARRGDLHRTLFRSEPEAAGLHHSASPASTAANLTK